MQKLCSGLHNHQSNMKIYYITGGDGRKCRSRSMVVMFKPGLVPVAYLQICSSSQQISPWQRKQATDAWKAWRRISQFLNSVFVASCSPHIFVVCLGKRPWWCLWRNSLILDVCCPKHLYSVFNVSATDHSIIYPSFSGVDTYKIYLKLMKAMKREQAFHILNHVK